jgi:flagellar hook-associated protein 3 FlgL
MTISGIGSRSTVIAQSLVDLRAQLEDLQRQLGTGKKSDDYAGLGLDRGLTVGLRSQLSALQGYGDTISLVDVRLDLVQTVLGRIDGIGHELKSTALQFSQSGGEIFASGQTQVQTIALAQFSEALGLLNTQAGDRYLFSGRATDQPSVETMDKILDGDGARAGLRQIIDERNQADLGASGLGRVTVTKPVPTAVAVTEDAVHPFGFKVAAISTTFTGATVAGPAGVPPAVSVDLNAVNPSAGQTVQIRFNLPDGTSETVTMTATTSLTPGPNEFTIGANTTITATNLQTALTATITKLADTSLAAASAIAAGSNFFAVNPPLRVAGPPFDTSVALVNGTPANTVFWYTGEVAADPARASAVAQIDQSTAVAYGTRANEEGVRWVIQHAAVLAAITFSPSDPDAGARSAALNQRMMPILDVPSGVQTIENIQSELAGTQNALARAEERHRHTNNVLENLLQGIEGISVEEVGAQILTLQTRLQASLRTTAMLFETSLVNYI